MLGYLGPSSFSGNLVLFPVVCGNDDTRGANLPSVCPRLGNYVYFFVVCV